MSALTKQEEVERRFTILEEQGKRNTEDHKIIMVELQSLNGKLDQAIQAKADKSELKGLSNRLWGFITAFTLALVSSFVGLLIYLTTNK